jgi:hypothetical protein
VAVLVGLVVLGGGDDDLDARLDTPGGYQEPDGLGVESPDGEALPDLELTAFEMYSI